MIIIETPGYKNSKKKIKNNYLAQDKLKEVISHIEVCDNYSSLKINPISKIYGFEELSGDLSGYCKFSLSISKLRLIFTKEEEQIVKFEYISDEYYTDFKKYLRRK